MRILRNILLGLAALVLLGAIAIYGVSEWKLRARPAPAPSRLGTPTAAQLADAPRQLKVLGCLGCHGDKLQGDIFLDDAMLAKLYAPNLTLVAARATDAQLDQAIRQGVGHDGRSLLVMPSEGYQFMTDQEVAAVIAAIRAMPKTGKATPSKSVGPAGRLGVLIGKFHTAPELVAIYRASPLPDLGPEYARGRQIVAVNCAECHGPDLKGQELEPGVVSADLAIAGAYDLQQFRRLLREGVAPSGKDIGLMGRIARRDFRHLTDSEIADVYAYLNARAQKLPD
jgi:mono/diheme cytochrome c family protein